MKMIDMKRDVKKSKSKNTLAYAGEESPYPYGLSLRLDNDGMEKLGLELSDLKVGDTMSFQIETKITSVSFNAGEIDKTSQCEFQITKIGKMSDSPKSKSVLKGHPASGGKS